MEIIFLRSKPPHGQSMDRPRGNGSARIERPGHLLPHSVTNSLLRSSLCEYTLCTRLRCNYAVTCLCVFLAVL